MCIFAEIIQIYDKMKLTLDLNGAWTLLENKVTLVFFLFEYFYL